MENIINTTRTELFKKLKVSEIMSKGVFTIDHDDLIAKAARLMMEHRVHSLLVIKESKPTYMLSSYDLLKVSYLDVFSPDNSDLLKTKVETLVEGQKLISIQSTTSLFDALALFVDRTIHSIPVIDDGQVNGILTLMDLARFYKGTHKEE